MACVKLLHTTDKASCGDSPTWSHVARNPTP